MGPAVDLALRVAPATVLLVDVVSAASESGAVASPHSTTTSALTTWASAADNIPLNSETGVPAGASWLILHSVLVVEQSAGDGSTTVGCSGNAGISLPAGAATASSFNATATAA